MLKMRTVETRLAGYGCVELLVEVIGKGKLIQLVVNNLALMVN